MALRLRKGAGKATSPRTVRDLRPTRGRRLALMPPEGVPLALDIAGLGARFGAQIVDLIVTTVAAALLIYALVFVDAVGGEALTALGSLIVLLFGTPYYIISELLLNGRTLGKKMLGIRVVSLDGRGLSTHEIVVRNLTKEVEVFVPMSFLVAGAEGQGWLTLIMLLWIAVVLVVPLRSKANQRLGDMAAGTAVVVEPRPVLLPDLAGAAGAPAAGRFVFTTAQLDLYGAYELQVLEQLLQAGKNGKQSSDGTARAAGLADIGSKIRTKIAYPDPVAPAEEEDFLRAFYTAQRGYLEQKKLFGDERVDKFHREPPATASLR